MSDVERLTAELELAKACELLEAARETMHADRSPKNIASYQEEANKVAGVRSSFRQRYAVVVGPGDAAPMADTVAVTAGMDRP